MRRVVPIFLMGLALAGCVAQTPSPDSADANAADGFSSYLSARFAASQHDLSQAAVYYGRSLKSDPASPSLLALSFFYAASAGDFANAEQYARKLVATTPDDRAARLSLAVTAFQRKDYADVRKQLGLSAKGNFTQLIVSLFDGWAAAATGDTAGVDKDIKLLLAQRGAESLGIYHAALLNDFLGKSKQAEASYKAAMSAGVITPRVLDAYGRFLERAGRKADALALYQGNADKPGFSSVIQPALARIAAGSKPDSLIRTPQDGAAEALFGIAASLPDRDSADISILYLRMALYLRPDLILGQVLLADRFESLREFDQAIAIYRSVPTDSPFYHMATVQIALDEQRLERPDAAIADLKKLVAADAKDVEGWTALGDAYRAAGRDGDALTAYDHAVEAVGTPAQRNWPLFYARAMTKEKLHRLDASEADINTALKLSPNQPELLNYLGYSWVDRGRHIDQAVAMLEKARSLRPNDGYIVDSVGWAYYKLGRYEDAANTLEQAVLMVPGDPTINEHFGDALWRAGRKIEARFQWYHALTFSDEATDKAALERKLKAGLTVEKHAG